MANVLTHLRRCIIDIKKQLINSYCNFIRMMFPIRDGYNLDNEPVHENVCKCFCKLMWIFLVFFTILVIGAIYANITETSDNNGLYDENGVKSNSHTCKVEIGDKLKEELKSWIQKEVETSSQICSKNNRMNPEQMRKIVKEEIRKQQKNQMKPDFASASAGGMVLAASPTWTEGYSYIYFMFIPIRSTAPSPSIILEPTRQTGDCWPMEGDRGSIVIQLAARANVVGFTLEHIDSAMSLSGSTQEAPNTFSVYGIEDPDDPLKDRHLFGTYFYDNNKDEENQYFRVKHVRRKSYLYIVLEILSNHGNDKYTCLYRFQVHGFIDRAYHCNN